MTTFFSGSSSSIFTNTKALLDMSMTPEIKQHVLRVYSTLAAALAVMSLGIYVHLNNLIAINAGAAHFVGVLLAIYIGYSSMYYNHNESQFWRLSALMSFAFFEGTQVGPLIKLALHIDPALVFVAAASTTAIFASFSLAALLAERRSYLYLGGILFSALNIMCIMLFATWLFPGLGEATMNVLLYGGLLLFSGFVIYDTQIMVERAALTRGGKADYIKDSLELFIDFVAILVRILIILIKNKASSDEKDKKKSRS